MLFWKKKQQEKEINLTFEERVELTLVDARAIGNDVKTLVNIALKNGYKSICVASSQVLFANNYIGEKSKLDSLSVVAVVGFPLGNTKTQVKVEETRWAVADGASEIAFVVNIGKIKEGDYGFVKNEMSRLVRISKGRKVTAIIETCFLTREEIKNVCKSALRAKVDCIQTSTGFGTNGATAEDIQLIAELVKGKCDIKATGGIKTRAMAEEMIRAGANKIGTSRVL